MRLQNISVLVFMFLFNCTIGYSQQIVYSEPEKEDSRKIDFEIIGKFSNNYLIYKNVRGNNFICEYDGEMKQVKKIEQKYMPTERLINVDFFAYADYAYMVYQYQKRNIVYCMAVKLDASGSIIGDPMELDTSSIGLATNNKIYTSISSEDKQKIIVFKINSKNRKSYLISTMLFDNKLNLLKKTNLPMPMDEFRNHLGEFILDNEGNLVFTKFYRVGTESISQVEIIIKKAMEDAFILHSVNFDNIYLDELRLKVDNFNGRYLLFAFYFKQKRGSIEGIYFYGLNKNSSKADLEMESPFGEDLRREAKKNANIKVAFNDYFLRNIFMKRDGGFIVDMEASYTTSKNSSFNRFDNFYSSPYFSPYDYYSYSPYNSSWRWRRDNQQQTRYHADNIVILSFDKNAQIGWRNVISKEQFDDEGEEKISYQVMNTGGQLHFLFNQYETRNLLLNDYILLPNGKVNRSSTLKNLDLGHEFMPKFSKQVGAKQLIVPCFFRNYICFAKIDFN